MRQRRMVQFFPFAGAAMALGLTLGAVPMAGAAGPAAPEAMLWQASSGGLFSPVIIVDGMGITRYEIDQRVQFMKLLRQTGDLEKEAEQTLIEDRIKLWQAKQLGVTVSDDEIAKGEAEFAGRANMSSADFIALLAKGGVDETAFRDFVRAGIAWRRVVRAQFSGRVHISEADIDRALLVESQRSQDTRVLLSEIIIPAPPEHLEEARQLARQVSELHGEKAFAEAAQQVSAAQTRDNGGRVDWMPLANLPPALRPAILALKPGQATQPIELSGAIGVFMLRDLDGGQMTQQAQKLGYALLTLGAPGAPEVATLRARVARDAKTCDDLYTVAKASPGILTRVQPEAQGAIPKDVAVELSHLDIGETGELQRGGQDVLLMLCSREKADQPAAPDRDAIRDRLTNAQVSTYADNYLADLVADAVIVRK